MSEMFEAEFFRNNRLRLRKLFSGTAPIIVPAAGLLQRSADTAFAFRQDSNFWYLTGIDEPDLILVIDRTKEYLIAPTRSKTRAIFDGVVDNAQLASISGIETIIDDKTGWKQLKSRLKRVAHVATLPAGQSYVDSIGMYTNPARGHLASKIQAINSSIEFLDLRPALTKLRAIKQPAELEALQQAINLTVKTMSKLPLKVSTAKNERQLEAFITGRFIASGGRHAYDPIIASGKNACTVHYAANNSVIEPDQFVLFDVGAEVSNYAADITRVYHPTEPTKRQQAVHAAVLEVQQHAKALLKPGVLLVEYEKQVVQFMGEKLRELGLIQTIDSEQVRQYYPYLTSHFLGLDVHDVGQYDQPLKAGMVLTVEPGIHIPDEGIAVRLEDDVLITETGVDVLSKKLTPMWYN